MDPIGLIPFLTQPITWLTMAFGMVVGSFLNVCIVRIPEGSFWQQSRSHCPKCRTLIPWYLNIPVLSYLVLRGRSRCCRTRISPVYPIVELATGIGFAVLYWHFPFLSYGAGIQVESRDFIRFGHAATFLSLLMVCSVIDFRKMIIPDVISLPMLCASPFVALLHPDLTLTSSLIGAAIGGATLYIIAWIYWIIRREIGLGFGDVKLLAAIGGWLGYQAIVPTILFGSVLGATYGISLMVIKRKFSLRAQVPFGPFLALGSMIHFLLGAKINEWLYVVSH